MTNKKNTRCIWCGIDMSILKADDAEVHEGNCAQECMVDTLGVNQERINLASWWESNPVR